jgi:hypothetical protein
MSTINKTSGYWLGSDIEDRYYDPITGKYNAPTGKDLFALSGYRNAISNFVRIVTGENIPVQFQGDDSYTDGKSVVLSSNIKSGNFDVSVGLALHEGSHIKLTDFTHLKRGIHKYIPESLNTLAKKKGVDVDGLVKSLLNVVEDRRIDKFIQTEAPGYRGYYEAMYDYYFNDKIIDKALMTQQWCEQTEDHYMAHIINFINPNRTLDLLPGLRKIWNILDLRNIARLKSTDDALKVALEMAEELLNNLPDYVMPEEPENKGSEGQDGGDTETSLKDKIANKLETLSQVLKKLDQDDPRVPKVFDQVKVLTEMWVKVKNND